MNQDSSLLDKLQRLEPKVGFMVKEDSYSLDNVSQLEQENGGLQLPESPPNMLEFKSPHIKIDKVEKHCLRFCWK